MYHNPMPCQNHIHRTKIDLPFQNRPGKAHGEPLGCILGATREPKMKSSRSDASLTVRDSSYRSAVIVLLMLGAVMVVSDPYFTFIEDEVQMISAAANPVGQIINLFIHGTGLHKHPPLYDLLLHGWLQITGGQMRLLRLPSMGFYLLGIGVLVATARKVSGAKAARTVLWVTALWPFGFHFGRLAAWYSLSFLLVATLTYRYLTFLTTRTFKNWLLAVIPAILLLYTSYFGWAILACVFLDYVLQTRHESRRHWPHILFTALLLIVAFLPLMAVFLAAIGIGVGNENSVPRTALLEAFNIYALFASESVAPWYWTLGIPVAIAITTCAASVLLYAPPVARRLFVYFLLLITGMSLLGIIGTKRLLMISAWAVLPVGLCLGTLRTRRWKAFLLACLLVIAGVGWFGTVARRFYAAPRFIEPWNRVAKQMAKAVGDGDVVIATHPSFFFYLTYELHRLEKGSSLNLAEVWPYGVEGLPVYNPLSWQEKGRPVSVNVFVVKDVSSASGLDDAETYLTDHCTVVEVNRLLPDSGFSLKERFLPGFPQVRYRIELQHYNCSRKSKLNIDIRSGSACRRSSPTEHPGETPADLVANRPERRPPTLRSAAATRGWKRCAAAPPASPPGRG